MTDWKPGDLCQVKRGKRWVDAEVVLIQPKAALPIRVSLDGETYRLRFVEPHELRPRPAKRGKLPEPSYAARVARGLDAMMALSGGVTGPTLTTPAAPVLRPVPKHKTARNKNYLAHVRTFPCCSCGTTEAIHAHHVASGGMGAKASDYLTAPLCGPCHSHWHATATLPALSEGGALLVAMSRSVLWMAAAKCLAAWVERER